MSSNTKSTKTITIGMDGNEANTAQRVGVNMYTYEMLWALYNLNLQDRRFVVYLKNDPMDDFPPPRKNWEYKILPGGAVWIVTKLVPHLLTTKDRVDVFFTPSHYIPLISPQPKVCAIMDLGYLDFSGHLKKYDFWQLVLWSAYSILVAKYILAISLSTKQEIVRHYPFAKNKIVVTPLSYDKKRFHEGISPVDAKRVAKGYGIDGEYVLFISTLKPSKNIEGLVEAWKEVAKDHPNVKLVIAGKKGWMYEQIFRKVRAFSQERNIIFTDYVAENDKPYLIAGAKALVLPSFWEGFGLDPLNAMACGIPVVVSNVGSLPEVVGEAGVLVDPYKLDTISSGIKKVLSMDKKDYNKLVQLGLNQAKKFSWEQTAKLTLEVLEKAANKK